MTDDSMAPILKEGDVALVFKLRYGLRVPGAGSILAEWKSPKKGDLVVAVSVGDPPMSVLRRITNVPGEKIHMPDGQDHVLKEDEFFLSAEQAEGIDSKKLGPVSRKSIIGVASYAWYAKNPSNESNLPVDSQKFDWRIPQPL